MTSTIPMPAEPAAPSRGVSIVHSLGWMSCALGAARLLARAFGFPGTRLDPDVVGWLSRHAYDKGAETGFFYYAVLLLPLAAWLGATLARKALAPARTAGSFLLASGGAAIALVAGAFVLDAVSFASALVAPAACLSIGLALERRAAGSASRTASARRRITEAFAGSGSTVLSGVALAIALLAAGPRVPMMLAAGSIRVAGVLAGCEIAAFGLALAVQRLLGLDGGLRLVGPAAARAMRHGAWLVLIRFAPQNRILVGIALALAAGGFAFDLWRARRSSSDADERSTRRFCELLFVPLLVAALVHHDEVNGAIDFYHCGEWLTPASEMLAGRTPATDIYLQHGLIQNALRDWVSFEWLGATFEVDRLSSNFQFALTHAAFYLLCLMLLRSPLLAALLALLLATEGLYLQPRFMGMFGALACALGDIQCARARDGSPLRRGGHRRIFAAGMLTSFAMFWSLDSGLYAFGAIGGWLLIDAIGRADPPSVRVRPIVAYAAGAIAAALPFCAWLASRGALAAFVANSIEQVRLQLSVWGLAYPPLREVLALLRSNRSSLGQDLADSRVVALFAATAFVLTPAMLVLKRMFGRVERDDWKQLLLAFGGIMLFRTALGRSDAGHLAYVSALLWPMAMLAALRCLRAPASGSALAPILRAAPLAALVLYFVAAYVPLYGMAQQWLRLSTVQPFEPGGGFEFAPLPRMGNVLIPASEAQALASLKSFMDERLAPDETFFDFSNMGAVYFFLDRRIPTRYFMAVYAATPRMQAEMIADLERSRPRYVVVSPLGHPSIDDIPMETRLPDVASWIARHYEHSSDEGFGSVFARVD